MNKSNAYEPKRSLSNKGHGVNKLSMNDVVGLAWGAKQILRDDFKKTEWGKTILPFIVLRRLGRVLEPTKDKVLSEHEKIKKETPEYVETKLNKITGCAFHNHSKYNLELLLADPTNLQKNIQSYIRGFSDNVQDIFGIISKVTSTMTSNTMMIMRNHQKLMMIWLRHILFQD